MSLNDTEIKKIQTTESKIVKIPSSLYKKSKNDKLTSCHANRKSRNKAKVNEIKVLTEALQK